MRFSCSHCKRRYSVSDERLLRAGKKVISLSCKTDGCENKIHLQLPIPEDGGDWYLVYPDDTFGPFGTQALRKYCRESEMHWDQRIRHRDAEEVVSIESVAAFADLFRFP